MSAKVGSLNVDATLETARFEQGLGRMRSALSSTDAQVQAWARSMNSQTEIAKRSMDRLMPSVNAQKAGLQQLGAQVGDMATMWSLGARPAQIFSSQIGQITGAIQLMAGGSSKFATFLGGPWGIAISTGTILLAPFIGKLFDSASAAEATRKALDSVQFASSSVGDAQSILGGVMDMTTGRINTQSKALLALAQAQLLVARVQAQSRLAEAKSQVSSFTKPRMGFGGGLGGGLFIGPRSTLDVDQRLAKLALSGQADAKTIIQSLDKLTAAGSIKPENSAKLAAAIANMGVEAENLKVFGQADALLNGQGGRDLLKPKTGGRGRGASGPDQASIDRQYSSQIFSLRSEELRARLALTTDLGERADFESDMLSMEREQRLGDIAATKGLTIDRQTALKGIVTALYGQDAEINAQGEIIAHGRPGLLQQIQARDRQSEELHRATDLQVAFNDNQIDVVQAQEALAKTGAERLRLGLEALKLDQASARAKAEQVIADAKLGKATAEQAKIAEDQLRKSAVVFDLRAENLRRQNAGPLAQFLAANDPKLLSEKVEGLVVEQLQYVSDGISGAITDRLGIKDPFLAGLIKLFIQQNLINPIAQAMQQAQGMGGGGGGLFGGLLSLGGSLLGGGGINLGGLTASTNAAIDAGIAGFKLPGYAEGTRSAAPGLAWTGEKGPELVRFRGGEQVIPNHMLGRGANSNGATGPMHFHFPGVTNAREARESAGQAARQFKRVMNGPVR